MTSRTDRGADAERHRNARRVVLKKYREAGVCQNGHDLTEPGALTKSGKTYRCVACGPRDTTLCRAGKHSKVLGDTRCKACRKEYNARPLRSSGPPKIGQLPPEEVLLGAICDLSTAHLFEQKDAQESFADFLRRTAQAEAICAGCPVREACLLDATALRRLGTYGGETFRSHPPKAAAA